MKWLNSLFGANFEHAIQNLIAAKLRTYLAVLGIVIGTASVVALISSGQMATAKTLAEFKTLGTDLLSVSIFNDEHSSATHRSSDTKKLVQTISEMPEVKMVAPYGTLFSSMSVHSHPINGAVVSATPNLQPTIRVSMESGRFLSFLDTDERFAVIGERINSQLRKNGVTDPIGQQIRIGNNLFTIIGVADHWVESSFFNQNINSSVIIPLEAGANVGSHSSMNNLIIRLNPKVNLDKLQDKISASITKSSPKSKIYFRSAEQLLDSMHKQQHHLMWLLGAIGSIALIVGGIGIMNIMLVSVTERYREIGLRLVVGAKSSDIRSLFLVEALVLTLFGGLIGVGVGTFAAYILAHSAHWDFSISLTAIFFGFTISTVVGVASGYYPAQQASRLQPIQALHID